MNMVEKMARAMHDALYLDEDSGAWMSGKCPLESVTIDGDVDLVKAARAALSAMMDATPGMVEAAKHVPCDGDVSGGVVYSTGAEARAIWQAMCRAALDEGEG